MCNVIFNVLCNVMCFNIGYIVIVLRHIGKSSLCSCVRGGYCFDGGIKLKCRN